MIDLVPLIRAAGVVQIGIALANAAIPRRLAVKQHITWLSPILRQVFLVHWLYILIVLAIFGGLSLVFAPDLAGASPLGRALSSCLAVFWGLRLVIQIFYYDSEVKRRYRLADAAMTMAVAFLGGVFAAAALGVAR